jgi:pimeloyl-ACP methyl ester carboxylesterase
MGARHVRANGLRFALLEQGPADGPLALCLHGFPDHAHTWRHLLPRLADAGFRAVAPWMRGYAPTQVPTDRATPPGTLTADVNALHRALGGDERAVLVGHDWGAVFAARAARAAPERWRSLVTLAVPPEAALLRRPPGAEQAWRSWYMLLAQVPGAERAFLRDDLALIEQLWRDWSPGIEPDPDDFRRLRATLADPGVMRAVLSYYRGFARQGLRARGARARPPAPPPQPHLHLHGADDGCIGVEYAAEAARVLPNPASRVEVLDAVGHFLHVEAPERVGAMILDHLAAEADGADGPPPR